MLWRFFSFIFWLRWFKLSISLIFATQGKVVSSWNIGVWIIIWNCSNCIYWLVFIYLLIAEHTEDELADFKAWFEILSRKSSNGEVCYLLSALHICWVFFFFFYFLCFTLCWAVTFNRIKEHHLRILTWRRKEAQTEGTSPLGIILQKKRSIPVKTKMNLVG